MSEPFFNFEGKTFNLDFEHDTLCSLYIIYDKVSKTQVSRIIEAKNDYVAILGFEKLLKDKEEKEHDISIYELYCLGDINYESKRIFESEDEDKFICNSNFDFEKFFEEVKLFINAQE